MSSARLQKARLGTVDAALRADSVFGPLLDGRVVQNVSVSEHGMEQVRTPPVRVRQCELT